MAIYKVTDAEAKDAPPRLIKARTKAEAVHFVTATRFEAETITKIEDAATLMADGIKLEIAGEELTQPASDSGAGAGPGDSPEPDATEGKAAS